MTALAYCHDAAAHAAPASWLLLVPLVWVAVAVGTAVLLRRTGWPGRGRVLYGMGPGPLPVRTARRTAVSPGDVLGRRFAEGEIDEHEYRRRLSVLERERAHGGGTALGHRAA